MDESKRETGRQPTLQPLLYLAALTMLLSQTPLQMSGPTASIPLPVAAQLEKLKQPPDSPDEAEAYYLAKREIHDEGPRDVFERYRSARAPLDKMPRYSTRLGKLLGGKAPQSGSAADLGRWQPLGPGNIGGRTRALLVHPQNPEILWAAGVSGGIWKTVDGGNRWEPLADFLPNIAVNSMAMDPDNPDVIYAGTGEGYFREVVRGTSLPLRGAGIFKTIDGGETWRRLASTRTSDFHWVNDVLVSPVDSTRVYASTRSGVWRSADSGATWTRVLATDILGGCFDLEARSDQPTDFLLASCGTFVQALVYRNPAAEGATPWEAVLSEEGMGLTSLAVAPSQQGTVYALSASYLGGPQGRFNGGLHAVFRSQQGGAAGSWTAQVRNSNEVKLNTLLLSNPLIATLQTCFQGQDRYSTLGWYTNMIAVDPFDPDIVWAGGVDLFRSDDGGENWGVVSYWWDSPPSAHADQHVIVFHPQYDGEDNQILFLGNDGGVWRSENARAASATGDQATCDRSNSEVVWSSLNHNYGVTQFYHGAPFPDGARFIGGTQDNGTLLGSDEQGPDDWDHVLGGDGGYVAVNPDRPETVYAESQFLALSKSTNGGRSFQRKTSGIAESGANFLFIAPFAMDPSDPRRLWIGGRQMWRTADEAESWAGASPQLEGGGKVSAIAVNPRTSQHLLVGLNNGYIHRQDQALVSSPLTPWPSVRPRSGFVSWIAWDPGQMNIAYASYAGFGGPHLWKTEDGGVSWSPLDDTNGPNSLPDIPIHGIVVDPHDGNRIFLATDLGVLVSVDGGSSWAVENSGFSNAVTESLALNQPAEGPAQLFAFTHGRGAWKVELSGSEEPVPCQPVRWIVHVTPLGSVFDTTLFVTNFGREKSKLELVGYEGGGGELGRVFLEVEPGQTDISLSSDLFGALDVSHFGFCGPGDTQVSAGYLINSQEGATAHANETSRVLERLLIYPGEWNLVFDGIAAINLGESPARITATLLNRAGEEVRQEVLVAALAPRGKFVAVLDAVFQDSVGEAIEILSSEPIAFLSLRGTRPPREPMLLFETRPVEPGNAD